MYARFEKGGRAYFTQTFEHTSYVHITVDEKCIQVAQIRRKRGQRGKDPGCLATWHNTKSWDSNPARTFNLASSNSFLGENNLGKGTCPNFWRGEMMM